MTTLLPGTQTSVQYGGLTFGAVDDNGVLWRIQKDGFAGWAHPNSSIDVQPKVRQHGAWAGDAFGQEQYYTFTLLLRAPSAALLNNALAQLEAAITLDEQPMVVNEAGFSRWVNVRRKQGMTPNKINSWMAAPTFQVVNIDGRRFGTPLVGTTGLPSSTGGLVIPPGGLVIPAGGLTIPAQVSNGQIEMFNPGNETGPVVLRVDGPISGPQISHVGSGLTLTFAASLVLGAGEWLDIDMEKHTVLANGQASRSRYITSRQWFGFETGDNTFSFAAASGTTGQLTVTATPAW
ncbi:phage distal tail protein [Humibacter sp.]|uniref:phage distal tail protein n=1 Tax=Humibacter sp. TaxID=1940291 RepID=UPI003F7DD24D